MDFLLPVERHKPPPHERRVRGGRQAHALAMQQPGSALRRAQQHEKTWDLQRPTRMARGRRAQGSRSGRAAARDQLARHGWSGRRPAPGAAIANALAIQSRMHDSRRHFTQGLNTCVAGSETRGKSTDSHPQSQNTGFYKKWYSRAIKRKQPPEGGQMQAVTNINGPRNPPR